MYFLRKKRQKRDREAGLIFQWRGARKHHLGKIIALMGAIGFFAFSLYAIKIDGIKTQLLSKREGVVIMLNDDDPACQSLMLQVEERSPFPARWDPVSDPEIMARIDSAKNALHGKLWAYDAELKPLPKEKSPTGLPSIIEPHYGLLGRVVDQWRSAGDVYGVEVYGDLFVRARVLAMGGLENRMPQGEMTLPVNLVADDWFGQTFRFQIRLNKNGIVTSCIPLLGGTADAPKITDLHKNLAAWIRTQQFKPSEPGSKQPSGGQLELQIEASRE
jgi:hypothetical protein